MKIEQVTHFCKDDPEMGGDYSDIELVYDGIKIAEFGDYYHDKGAEQAEGFILGVEWTTRKPVTVKHVSIADREY